MSLDIVVQPRGYEYCHSVWVDPVVFSQDPSSDQAPLVVVDGLQRAEIAVPVPLPEAELCIVTVGSVGFEQWIDDLFGSICTNAQCPDALLAIVSIGDSTEIRDIAKKYRAVVIPCQPRRDVNLAVKSVMYAAGRVIKADKFVCLDADMLVLDSLQPIVAAIDASPPGSILTCREGVFARDLGDAVKSMYGGHVDDIGALFGGDATHEIHYPFATLHYLIRSNGCSRVIETGTARGVSAACLASAVAHRENPSVVTIDMHAYPERDCLWDALPEQIRKCIVPRLNDAHAGLREAIAAGETYHAALLDSVHSAGHVLQEFELARQLVCPGGLILIHDAILKSGTVGAALDQIAEQGYGVVRLWTAEGGIHEDDGLGLAVIENRCRKTR